MAINDFKALAVGGGANVITQAEFEALATLIANGFTSGVVPSNTWNKIARQSSVIASVVAQYIADSGLNALDNGNTATLLANLKTAISTQIDQRFSGKDPKESVRIASTANVASLSGLSAIDGVTPIAGDRILLKNQTAGADNGIYVAAAGAWARSADGVTGTLTAGASIPVTEGTVNGDTLWLLTTNDPIVVGTTALVFVSLGGISQATADTLYAKIADAVPVGTILDHAATTVTAGYLLCPTSQTNVSRTTYAALFAKIGTTWGVGDGSTTFGLPWFAANYAAVQASANVGTASVGENLAHIHTVAGFATAGASGSLVGVQSGTQNTSSNGGSANLAAGVRVLKMIKF
jgi:phage-related tail fiber protein